MPKISIIMPCHNGDKYIREAIESVIAQTFTDWELLVINDNSSDTSVSIISEFTERDSRIKLLNLAESNGMPSAPRNMGITEAQGQYIAFLDCDDKWLPSKLENQLKLFEDNNCVVAFSYYKKMDENGNIHDSVIYSPANVKYNKLLNGNCIGNLTGMYDSAKVGKIYQKSVHHEDYLMWLEILKSGLVAKNTNTVEAVYRESKKSTSGNKLAAFVWTWQIYRSELKLNIFSAFFHFITYAFKAVIKFIK